MSNTNDTFSLADQLSQQLETHYDLETGDELIAVLLEMGIPKKEANVIVKAFNQAGRDGFIEVREGDIGKGYSIQELDYSHVSDGYTIKEVRAEIKRLQTEIASAITPAQRASLRRQLAEFSNGVVAIHVGYTSVDELDDKMSRLLVYIVITQEIINRSLK